MAEKIGKKFYQIDIHKEISTFHKLPEDLEPFKNELIKYLTSRTVNIGRKEFLILESGPHKVNSIFFELHMVGMATFEFNIEIESSTILNYHMHYEVRVSGIKGFFAKLNKNAIMKRADYGVNELNNKIIQILLQFLDEMRENKKIVYETKILTCPGCYAPIKKVPCECEYCGYKVTRN